VGKPALLKDADHERLTRLSVAYFERAGYVTPRLKPEGFAVFIESGASLQHVRRSARASAGAGASGVSSSRLLRRWVMRRFAVKPVREPARRGDRGARRGAAVSAAAPRQGRVPRVADRVKQKTGQKGRALFHPIRIALTGATDGPELDLLVPAIERGADLDRSSGIAPIAGARERAREFTRALDQ
jgi:hypothetical protein